MTGGEGGLHAIEGFVDPEMYHLSESEVSLKADRVCLRRRPCLRESQATQGQPSFQRHGAANIRYLATVIS